MNISAYAVCYNEQELLPFYLSHYASLATRIVIWDNFSTDRSVEVIKSFPHPNIQVRQYHTDGEFKESALLEVKNNCWKGDDADFVIVGDIDEFLYCTDLPRFLAANAAFDLFRPRGFDMFSEAFPTDYSRHLTQQVKDGATNPAYSKAVLFRPNRVREINYHAGCHSCNPVGEHLRAYDGERLQTSPLMLCHYKNLGLEYRVRKHRAYGERLGEDFRRHRWGWHYTLDEEQQRRDFADLRERSYQVLP